MSAQAAGRTTKEQTSVWPAIQSSLAKMDYQLMTVVAILLLIGLVMVFSASFSIVGTRFFLAQLRWVAVGALACAVAAFIPYEFWRKMAIPALGFTILILIAVLVLGQESEFGATAPVHGRQHPAERARQARRRHLRCGMGGGPRAQGCGLQAGLLPVRGHHRARRRAHRAGEEHQHDHHRAGDWPDHLLRGRRLLQAALPARPGRPADPGLCDVASSGIPSAGSRTGTTSGSTRRRRRKTCSR